MENNTVPIRFHLNFDTLYEEKVQAGISSSSNHLWLDQHPFLAPQNRDTTWHRSFQKVSIARPTPTPRIATASRRPRVLLFQIFQRPWVLGGLPERKAV